MSNNYSQIFFLIVSLLVYISLASPDFSNITAIAIDRNNHIYVGTSYGNVWNYTGTPNVYKLLTGSSIDGSAVEFLAIDNANNIYINTQQILWKYSLESSSLQMILEWTTMIDKNILMDDTGTNFYVYGYSEFYHYSVVTRQWTPIYEYNNEDYAPLFLDKTGNFYFGCGSSVKCYSAGVVNEIGNGLPVAETVISIIVDNSRNVYAATPGDVFVCPPGENWSSVPLLFSHSILVLDSVGNIYAGTNDLVLKYQNNIWTKVGGTLPSTVSVGFVVNNGIIDAWLHDQSVVVLEGDKWKIIG